MFFVVFSNRIRLRCVGCSILKNPHKYLHGKQTETMNFEDFDKTLRSNKYLSLEYQSFLTFLYLTGCRLNEVLSRNKRDFIIEDDLLVVTIPASKKGERDFLELELSWPYVSEFIVPYVESVRGKDKRVWQFTARTAQRLVKKIFGDKYYPHYFRLNAAVSFCRNPDTSIQNIKAWFGWKRIETINKYMGLARRDVSEARKKRGVEFEKLARK